MVATLAERGIKNPLVSSLIRIFRLEKNTNQKCLKEQHAYVERNCAWLVKYGANLVDKQWDYCEITYRLEILRLL